MISGTSARLLSALLLVGILLLASPAYAGVNFEPVVNVSNSRKSGATDGPGSLAVNTPYVYAVWLEEGNVFFSRSTNGGATFSAPTQLVRSGGAPKVASSGQNVYVAWSQVGNARNTGVYFKRSTDNGVTFGPEVQLRASGDIIEGIAVSGSNVYIVFAAYTGTRPDVIMARSADSGATFFPLVNLSMSSAGTAGIPRVVADASNVYVVWTEPFSPPSQIVFTSSANSGASFAPPRIISDTSRGVFPALAAASPNVYVVYSADSADIRIVQSTNDGLTFGPGQYLSGTGGPASIVGHGH